MSVFSEHCYWIVLIHAKMNTTQKNTLIINKKEIERILFLSYVTDKNLVGLIGNRFTPKLFEDVDFQIVSFFVNAFWKKFDRIPTKEETNLFNTNPSFPQAYQNAKMKVANVDVSNIDKEILYPELEKYIKKRCYLLFVQDTVDKIANKNENALNPELAIPEIENIASLSLWDAHVFDAQKDVLEYFEQVNDAAKRLPTGYTEIDEKINGGILADGKFIGVIFAETNMGKSIMLTNLATNAVRQGKNVLVISLEMSEIVYATRAYADLYDLPIKQIHFMKEELTERISEHPEYGKLYIKEFPPSTMTVEQIGGFIENLINQGFEFGLCCIDYLTLLTAPNGDNSNEVGKEISRKLRALTYRFSFPIMTAAQLNRDGFDAIPSNKNVAESIAIPQEVDWAIGLYQQKEDKEQGIMRVKCTKSRLGTNDWTVNLRYNSEMLRFEDLHTVENNNTTKEKKNESLGNKMDMDSLLETFMEE